MAAQDAELKLKVSLDLAFLRQQLSTIGTQLAGQGIDISAAIDEDDVVQQYKSLAKTLESKTIKLKVESTTLDSLVIKAANLKKSLEEFGKQDISLDIKIASNIAELRKSIKDKLPSVAIDTHLNEPVNVDDFIRDVAKKVDDQVKKSYVAGGIPIVTKLALPGLADPLKALQKNLNQKDPLRAKVGATPSIQKSDVTAFKTAVNEKFKDITVKIKAELGDVPKQSFAAGQTGAAGLFEYMRSQGLSGGNMPQATEVGRSERLKKALEDLTVKQLQALAKEQGIGGVSRLKKDPLIDKLVAELNQDIAENILGNIKNQLRDVGKSPLKGVLDTFARGLFNMLGMDPASMRQQMAQQRALPALNFPATVPPRQSIPIGPSSTGRTLPAGRAAAGMIGAAQAPAGLLPSVTTQGGLTTSLEALIQSLISQTRGRGLEGPGAIVSMETGFIPAMRERFAKAAERYLFGVETQVMDLFDAALRQVESAVDLHIAKIQGQISQRMRRAVSVVDLGVQGRPMLPGAATGRAPLMLPAAPEPAPTEPQMRISGGYNRPAPLEARPFYMAPAFASTTRRIPGSAGRMARGTAKPKMVGQEIPLGPSGGGPEEAAFVKAAQNALKFGLATDIAKKSVDNFRASQLPLIGGLREIGGEFGFAIKQVLLFGTAYKALAFVQSLPGQILNAAKSQQQYNNALQTATQDTGTFAKELLYVDNVQRAFGLNLETTRTGFARLYASMAPTGFDSGSIEKLFTGISAATAALQLTPDKAERVIYAFGQMASKGQIMSEELKGQLGDVLPGALAIFAKAAGMSVKEFSKAMEDGEFVGSKFRDTFAKVADELMRRFGTGAQAAGKSLQGLLNTVQGDFRRTLESFAPLADAAAQAILGPLGGSLKQLSMSAQIATGEIERTFMQLKEAQKDLGDLRTGGADASQLRAAEQNVAALTARYKTLQQAAQDPAIAKQAQDIQLFTQELAKAGTFVMNTAKAIGSVLSPILNILGTNLTTVISLVTSFYIGFQTARLAAMALMGVLLLYRGLSALLGFGAAAQQATALAGAFNILGVSASRAQIQVVGLRLALTALVATTVIGAVVAGIVAIAGAFATMSDRAKEAAQSSRDAAKAAVDAAASGNVAGAQMSMQNILAQSRADKKALETLRSLRSRSTALQREGGFSVSLTPEESAALQGSELTKGMLGGIRGGRRQMQLPTAQQMQRLQQDFGRVAQEQKVSLQEAKSAVTTAQQVAKNIGLNVPTPSAISPEAEEPDEKAKRAAEKAAEDARKLADDKRKYEADLMKISSQQAINLNEMEFDHWKNLQQAKYDFLEAGQNEWMSRELKFQRDLQAIEIRRIEAIRKARIETVKAETDAQASAYVAGDSGVGGGAAMFGATGRVFNAPGWVHGHFQNMNREALVQDTVEVVMKLLQQGVKPELGSGQKFTAGMQQAQVEQLVRRGIASHKSYASGVGAIDVFVPQGTRVPVGLSGVSNLGGAAGISGNLPRGTQLMHLDPSSRSGAAGAAPAGVPASRIRAEAKRDYASALASQEAINAKEKENLATKYANIQAQQELNVLIREYTASIVPVEQQKLENTLLQNRINLISSGAFGDALETEQKISEAREKAALGVQMANAQIEQNNRLVKDGIIKQEEADKLNASQVEKIKQLTQGLEAYIPLLRERLKLEQSSAEATLRGEITRATPLGGMGLSAGFIGPASDRFEEAIGRGATQDEASRFAELQNQLTLLESRNEAIKQSIYGIGNAFGEALTTGVASLVSGTATAKEVFASFLQSVGQALSQAAAQMIATYIAIGIAKMFAGLGGGGGNPAGSGGGISDSLPGIRQYAGGLGGGGAPGSMPFAPPAFANGGIVTGPTLSLIGEGKYNEAVVPLPDGRSIPVQLGGRSARDLMGNGAPGMPQTPSLSMKFETTKINGVEYVSREQLEQAMMETRKKAARDGAAQGSQLALSKIRNSPSTRRQIGV